jgi:ketosteroid isomerase-like protein
MTVYPTPEAERELIGVAQEWAKAIVANDAARIRSFMTDDWVMVSDSGVSTREQFLAFVESGDLTHSKMDMVSEPGYVSTAT